MAERAAPAAASPESAWHRGWDPLPIIDGLLAATAHVHGFTLVTRNVRDVARTGVALHNPFSGSAGGD
jgi:predicted nucleic acid-binding protein